MPKGFNIKNVRMLFELYFFIKRNFKFYTYRNFFFFNCFFLKNYKFLFKFSFFFYTMKYLFFFLRKKGSKGRFYSRFRFFKFFSYFFFLRRALFKRFKSFFYVYSNHFKKLIVDLSKKKKEEKKVVHFKRKIFLQDFLENSFLVFKSLFLYKFKLISNLFIKFDPIFFSFFFHKFLTKFMSYGKKFVIFYVISSSFFFLKFFSMIKPFFLFFSAFESSRFILGHIPKNLSGKIHIVPTYLFFDKQFKLSIKAFVSFLKKKREYGSFASTSGILSKKKVTITSFFLKNQKVYFWNRSKFIQRTRNVVFDSLKKDYYLYLKNRSNLQYRWR